MAVTTLPHLPHVPEGAVEHVPEGAVEHEASTREQVLHLVVSRGPIAAGDIAASLRLTPPAVRRHLAALEANGQIVAKPAPGSGKRGRGRPARCYVATAVAHDGLSAAYADLAVSALGYLAGVAGDGALHDFARIRAAELEGRYQAAVDAAGSRPGARAEALAEALSRDGYEATTRPLPGTGALQLCQGHCPVRQVAARFPQLCEAETQAFSRLLGVHVQRLATLARGEHVCTTHVPTAIVPSSIAGSPIAGSPIAGTTSITPTVTSTAAEGPR